jgi:hypothetical protein
MGTEYSKNDPFSSPALQALKEFAVESERREVGSVRLEDFERELHRRVLALEADLLRHEVERYDLDVEEVKFEGQPYRRKMKSRQEYMGLAGTFVVDRWLYVPRSRIGKAICPLELRAGIVEALTPAAAKLIALAVAFTTPKEAASLFGEWGGMKPSTSTLDRLPKRLSEKWEEQRESFEDELRVLDQVPRDTVTVAVSIDGVQVPMKDGDRVEKRSQEDKKPVGPAGFREVGCGTITFHDRRGNRLKTVRYGRMPEAKKVTLKRQLEAELESLFASRPNLTLVCLSDGFEDHWAFLSKLSSRFVHEGKEKNEVIDLYHVLGRVKMALNAYHGDNTPETKIAFEQCRIWLREKDDGAKRVIRHLRHCRDGSEVRRGKPSTVSSSTSQTRKVVWGTSASSIENSRWAVAWWRRPARPSQHSV